ncbi:MAG: siphovirus Gp157 family protein [Cyanobacteriota bacterium]|nr:siphovirus Gp157 family protein [Cyanobacteriota bacterium]
MIPTSKPPTLDELERQLTWLSDYLDSDDSKERQALEAMLDKLMAQIEGKLDGYIAVIRREQVAADTRHAEAKRQSDAAKVHQNNVARLKTRLQNFLERREAQLGREGRVIRGFYSKVSLCQNGGKPSLWLAPHLKLERVPERYVRITRELDEDAIRADLEAGAESICDTSGLPFAQLLPRGKHLRIT